MIQRAFLILSAFLISGYPSAFSEEPSVPKAETKPAKKERSNIAVMDFNDRGVSKNVAVVVSNAVRSALFDTRRFNVLEQSSMEAILQEQAFQKSGCTTAECAVEIGKLLNMK